MKKQLNLHDFEAWQRTGKTTVHVAAISALVLGGTLALLPSTASAHNNDNITATYTEGEGFPTAGALAFQAEGRLGNSNSNNPLSGDWELGVGTNTQNPDTSNMEDYDWENEAKDFTVTYDGNGQATLQVEGGTSTSFDVGDLPEDAKLYIVGVNKAGGLQSTNLTNLTVDGQQVEAGNSVEGDDIILSGFGPDVGYLEIAGSDLSDGFTVSGSAYFTSTAADGSAQAFQVQVRGDQTDDDGNSQDNADAPVVNLISPRNGATVDGDVRIRASVQDEDPDHYHLRIDDRQGNRVFSKTFDQTESFTNRVIHTFNTDRVDDGRYTIFLSARDDNGNKDGDFDTEGESVDRHTVTVANDDNGNNAGLNIEDDFEVELRVGNRTTLEPEITGGGDDLTYEWDTSDRRLVKPNQPLDEAALTIGPAPAGDYTATLMVSDEDGNETEATYDVSIVTPGNGNGGGDNGDDNGNNGGNDNGNNNGDNGNDDNRRNNPLARLFVDLRGSVNIFFVNVYNFFGFRF